MEQPERTPMERLRDIAVLALVPTIFVSIVMYLFGVGGKLTTSTHYTVQVPERSTASGVVVCLDNTINVHITPTAVTLHLTEALTQYPLNILHDGVTYPFDGTMVFSTEEGNVDFDVSLTDTSCLISIIDKSGSHHRLTISRDSRRSVNSLTMQ